MYSAAAQLRDEPQDGAEGGEGGSMAQGGLAVDGGGEEHGERVIWGYVIIDSETRRVAPETVC